MTKAGQSVPAFEDQVGVSRATGPSREGCPTDRAGTDVAFPALSTMMPTLDASVPLEPPLSGALYAVGDVVAHRYRLEAPIGSGGMGTVWRAHNELLDAPLALKLLRRNAHWSGSCERLLLEAKAAACLRHPAIVRAF